MNTTLTPLHKAKGSVLVLTALSLLVIMGMLGLAIDLGNAYVNKTRLQNALDAMVLSAAISLVNERVGNAVADAQHTFDEYNLTSVDATTDIDICFFDNYSDINANSPCDTATPTASSRFVRGAMKPENALSVATTFASLIGFAETNIHASAVSGPLSLNNLCTLIPVVACAEMVATNAGADGIPNTKDDTRVPADKDCTDDNCYGLTVGANVSVKNHSQTDIGPGNFNLLDVGSGADAVCEAMAGNLSCTSLEVGGFAKTQTGFAAEPTACINVRLDDYTHGREPKFPADKYPPDTNVVEYTTTAGSQFQSYLNDSPFVSPDNTGIRGRRIVHIPFVDCADGGGAGGTVDLSVEAMGCFLLTNKVDESGAAANRQVLMEFIGDEDSDPLCEIGSKSLPNAKASPFAPTRVVLFKDPVSGDA